MAYVNGDEIVDQMEAIIQKVQKDVDTNDLVAIKNDISFIELNIKNYTKIATYDKFSYLVLQFLNRIMYYVKPIVRRNAYESFSVVLLRMIDNVDFEKEILIEIKECLENVQKEHNYIVLPQLFTLLFLISGLQGEREHKLEMSYQAFYSDLRGIQFFSPECQDYIEEIENTLKEQVKKLK